MIMKIIDEGAVIYDPGREHLAKVYDKASGLELGFLFWREEFWVAVDEGLAVYNVITDDKKYEVVSAMRAVHPKAGSQSLDHVRST